MSQRMGYSFIGTLCIVQIHLLFNGNLSFSFILSQMVMDPLVFLVVALLFLMGFLMFSSFFHYWIRMFYSIFRHKMKIRSKHIIEWLIFSGLLVFLFQYSFWLSGFACLFAVGFALTAINFREERKVDARGGRRE